jgi:hypothetical protein
MPAPVRTTQGWRSRTSAARSETVCATAVE